MIQQMLEYAKTIEEPEKRQKMVEAIIGLMQQLNPAGNRNMDDYREKLWNHALAIVGYDLDIQTPSGVTVRKERIAFGRPDWITRLLHNDSGITGIIFKP